MTRPVLWCLAALVAAGGWFVGLRHHGDVGASVAELRGLAGGSAAQPVARAPAPNRVVVATVAAEAKDFPVIRTSVGWIEPMASVVVRPQTDGTIVEQTARDGATVKRGDPLFRLDDREIRAQISRDEAALVRNQATEARAKADVERVGELLKRSAASPQQFEIADAAAKVASADVVASRATLEADKVRLDYTVIRAPIAGRLGTIRVTEGNLVKGNESGGTGLVTITQMKPLRATFSLPEGDLDLLRAAIAGKTPAAVRAIGSAGDGVLATGKLSFVDSSVDQASGTVTAWALFSNDDDRLWPGQYVRVEVDLATRPKTTMVPLVAVQPGQAGAFVYVARDDGKGGAAIQRRPVEVLTARGVTAAIAKGLEAGERVVVEGQLRVREGTPVDERPIKPEAAPQARAGAAQVAGSQID